MHPLFAKIDETMSVTDFVKALDFDVFVESGPVDAWTDPKDHSFVVPDWAVTGSIRVSAQGFSYAGCWENDDGIYALFVKPKTPLACALWWCGTGARVKVSPRIREWGVMAAPGEFMSVYPDKDLAKQLAEERAQREGKSSYSIAAVDMPLPSEFVPGNGLLEEMTQCAEERSEHGEDWLTDIPTHDMLAFDKTVGLLVDGFVWEQDKMPHFAGEWEDTETFPVSQSRSNLTPSSTSK